MTRTQPISAELEDYLEALLQLERDGQVARVSDIARRVAVHKSTVTAALKTLGERGLVAYAPYAHATLTPEGRAIATAISRNHEIISHFLRDVLLVDEATAEANACRMEHVMDKEVLERLVLFAHYMQSSPRGGRNGFARVVPGRKS